MQKLKETDSNNKVFDFCTRHRHLSLQTPNGSKYAAAIAVPFNHFETKMTVQNALINTYRGAVDKVYLYGSKLNQCLRKVIGRSREYDRENHGQKVTGFLFPNGNVSPVIRLTAHKKPEVVADILRKLQSLGETNGLFMLYTELKAAYDALIEIIGEETKAYNDVRDGATYLLQAKIKLVKQYNDNYHIAAIDYDKNYAEMLYPAIRIRRKKVEQKEIDTYPVPN